MIRGAAEFIGDYRLIEPIGRGSSSVVYRAVQVDSGAIVALKTISVPAPHELEGLRREVHTLRRIIHPGIVRVVDSGVHQGFPWYAMTLIERGTLADLWDGQTPPSAAILARSLQLIQRLCMPLAFLHGEGIVHRDLKPQNIAIGEEDQPIIVDFGLVASFGGALSREALEAGGWLSGTLAYIAPEQARGEYVDARADLYSLGCILYEAATGRPPFVGSPTDIFMGHLEAQPQPPSSRAAGLDPRLEQLIMRLLTKQPRLRFGYAEDVAVALRAITGTPPERTHVRPRSYLYRPSFAGRDTELELLVAALDHAAKGAGRCIVVAGESGAGKTRLAMEMTRVANARGFRVITGQCVALESAGPGDRVSSSSLHPVRALLRALADQCSSEGVPTTERIFGRRAKVLAAYEAAVAEVPGYAEQPEPAQLSSQAARERVLADFAATLAEISREEPVLLVIDDLQWADDMTLALLRRISEGFIEHTRLVVLGTYRSDEVTRPLESLLSSPGTLRINLDRLDQTTVRSILSDMLAMERPPIRLTGLLSHVSEGNPFFVGEYLRAAVEAGFLVRSDEGRWALEASEEADDPLRDTLPLPNTLRELLVRRIADLEPVALSLVEAGAVLGREFDIDLTTQLVEVNESDRLGAINHLLGRLVLETTESGGFRFAHDKLREVAYECIAEPRRIHLHRSAAQVIESRHSGEGTFPQRYAELAHHWLRAGVISKAVGFFGSAGRYALETGAHDDAHQLLVRALALDDELGGRSGTFVRAQWRRMLGVASFGIGDLDASIQHTKEALVSLRERVPTSNRGWGGVILTELGRQLFRRLTGGLRVKAAAADPQPGGEALAECAQACSQLATSFFYRTDTVPAVANVLRGLNRAERAGVDNVVLESSARLAYVTGSLGLHRVARFYFDRAEATMRRANDQSGWGVALYLESEYRMGMAQWKESQAVAERSTEILDEIGDRQEAETARAIAAHCYFFSGAFEKATDLILANTESAESRSHAHHVAWGQFMLARSRMVEGEVQACADLLEQAYELLKSFPDTLSVVMCEGLMVTALARCGRTAGALEIAARLTNRLDTGTQPGVPQALDGYDWLAEGFVELCARGIGEPTELRAGLSRACFHLGKFSRMFRMGLPAAQRASGHALRLGGHPDKALRVWHRALQTARSLQMPYEEARVHRELARFSETASDRDRHRGAAIDMLSDLGCDKDADGLARESKPGRLSE